jgi:hypothetical protein
MVVIASQEMIFLLIRMMGNVEKLHAEEKEISTAWYGFYCILPP